MKIALFGGTFDPIHTGHVRAAKVAARKFRLDRILFIPSGRPPHKYLDRLTPFPHRFAMVTLACTGDPRFIPSLLEAPKPDGRPQYSVTTAQAVRRALAADDQLYFLLGADAFLDLPHWKDYRRLFDLVNFIVVSRPGFGNKEILKVVPDELVQEGGGRDPISTTVLRCSTLSILRGIDAPIASRDIREAMRNGLKVAGLVPQLVEEYILKEGLYRPIALGQTQR